MKILIVEDDRQIASVVRRGLERANYTVEAEGDGDRGLKVALEGGHALIILDLMLPGRDGQSICRALRTRGVSTPILMLTALDTLDDRVSGLEIGADDYLVKPFEFPELLARVRALIRRDHVYKGAVIRIADLVIEREFQVVKRDGRVIPLSKKEYALLEALAVNEGRILSRDYIRDRIWSDDESYSNTVDAFIKQLRRKIDVEPLPKLIHTVYGMGYVLRDPGTPEEKEPS